MVDAFRCAYLLTPPPFPLLSYAKQPAPISHAPPLSPQDGFKAYFWVLIYFFTMSLEMVYGKLITRDVKVELGTSVFLTNMLTLPFMFSLSVASGESPGFMSFPSVASSNISASFLLLLSCFIGAGIGFSGWWCRSLLSATSFTVVGIVNKVLTVFLNIMMWDKHSSFFGTFCLLLTLLGGVLYEQAPLKSDVEGILNASSCKSSEMIQMVGKHADGDEIFESDSFFEEEDDSD